MGRSLVGEDDQPRTPGGRGSGGSHSVLGHSQAHRGSVVLAGLTVLLVVACLTVLVATVLPALAGCGVAFLLAMALLAMLHAH